VSPSVDNTEGNVKLAEAVDIYLSMMLSKPRSKRLHPAKCMSAGNRESLQPILDRVEVFRYGKRKYLLVAILSMGLLRKPLRKLLKI
jgi:hypothetical protein